MRNVSLPLVLALCAGSLAAQSSSSKSYFLVAAEQASGGTCQTSQFVLTSAVVGGVGAARSASQGHTLVGGFTAMLETVTTGKPWLTGVLPRFATMRGGAALTLNGTELDLGPVPTVTIGGQTAPLLVRTNDAIGTTLPNQPVPGYLPVEVQSALGTATLPRGLGVLPLVEAEPLAANVAGNLVYRGRQGDQMVWALALARSPFKLTLPPFGHALELDFATLIVTDAQVVTDPGGVNYLPVPALAVVPTIYVQALALSSDPGYAPGSFTNTVRIF